MHERHIHLSNYSKIPNIRGKKLRWIFWDFQNSKEGFYPMFVVLLYVFLWLKGGGDSHFLRTLCASPFSHTSFYYYYMFPHFKREKKTASFTLTPVSGHLLFSVISLYCLCLFLLPFGSVCTLSQFFFCPNERSVSLWKVYETNFFPPRFLFDLAKVSTKVLLWVYPNRVLYHADLINVHLHNPFI